MRTPATGAGPVDAGVPDLGFTLGGPAGATSEVVRPATTSEKAVPTSETGVPTSEKTGAPDLSDGAGPSPGQPTPEERARELVVRIAQALGTWGPPGWRELSAVFAMTTVAGGGRVSYADDREQVAQAAIPDEIVALADEQRRASADNGDEPWWRMLVRLDADGTLEVDFDYGDEPFPDEQLFAPEAYLADLEEFPRRRLPMWLAAYLYHGGRQLRSPAEAAGQARADRAAGIAAVAAGDELPDLPAMWVRWTVMSAAFVAVRSEWGPRILHSMGWFESSRRSGSTLYLLPGGRAVLSGGIWDAASLAAAYTEGAPLPQLYAGAPDWVVDQVLNARAGSGLLSFCYWWAGDRWYRAAGSASASDATEPRAVEGLGEAVPGIWSDDSVEQVVCELLDAAPGDRRAGHVSDLLAAAFDGVVTRSHLLAAFGPEADIDTAVNQMTSSGAAIVEPPYSIRGDDR